jgi:rubrerythrin
MSTPSLLEAIRVVKENEQKASVFYANAAKNTASPIGRHLFEQLKEFELFHYARLAALEQSLLEKDDFIYYEGKTFPLPPTIEPKPVEDPQHQTTVNIISEAMELEKQAEKAYSDLAGEITDPKGHEMFRKLSEEEHNHYRILNEAYWNLNNFRIWKWSHA